jgi:hypothetical protein
VTEVSSLTIKIDPKQGTFDAAASGESALLALVVIAAMMLGAMTVWVVTKERIGK